MLYQKNNRDGHEYSVSDEKAAAPMSASRIQCLETPEMQIICYHVTNRAKSRLIIKC